MATRNSKTTKEKLQELRNALLQLHQKLLDYQRRNYEREHGRVQSSSKMFTLASSSDEFAWLRSLSELIVGLDGYLDAKKFETKNINSLVKYTKQVLIPKARGNEFEQLYYKAVQIDPAILIAHRKVMALLTIKRSRKIDTKMKAPHT